MSNQGYIIFFRELFDYEVLRDIASKNLDIKKEFGMFLVSKRIGW